MPDNKLLSIEIDKIVRNPENPRIVFRPGELGQLTDSIRKYGIQVPLAVYREGNKYVLIDGERRWRCAIKLNLKQVPAIVQPKPDRLSNLLLMFNIHALREQWDLLTIALKLPDVVDLLKKKNSREPTERDLSAETGLTQGVIRRCKMLMALPDAHQDAILAELKKPKPQQTFTEDFYIEMERALTTVERNMPVLSRNLSRESMRQVLITKFKNGTISNRVDFRQIAKIARAEKVDADKILAQKSLERLFTNNNYSIEQAYEHSVAGAYGERDLLTRISGLSTQLHLFEISTIDDDIREALQDLQTEVNKLLGSAQ
jgi:ParB family transcriptional regulator, chromosome partitioning protein